MANENVNPVTGLYTAGILKLMLSHELAVVQRHPVPLALLRIAADPPPESDAAMVNDALLAAAQVFNTYLRASDIPVHYENDYLVGLPVTDEAGACGVAQRLARLLSKPHSRRGGGILQLSVYVGLTSVQSGSKVAIDDFIAQASAALAEARRRGPGSTVTFSQLG